MYFRSNRKHAQFSESVTPVLHQFPLSTAVAVAAAASATPPPTNPAASMQLMPYNSMITKKPLTPDELKKLYNMGPFAANQTQINSTQYLTGTQAIATVPAQYLQQQTPPPPHHLHHQAQNPIYPYAYPQTIERPLMTAASNVTYSQHPMMINTLTMHQQHSIVNYSNNLSTNMENTLALVSLLNLFLFLEV